MVSRHPQGRRLAHLGAFCTTRTAHRLKQRPGADRLSAATGSNEPSRLTDGRHSRDMYGPRASPRPPQAGHLFLRTTSGAVRRGRYRYSRKPNSRVLMDWGYCSSSDEAMPDSRGPRELVFVRRFSVRVLEASVVCDLMYLTDDVSSTRSSTTSIAMSFRNADLIGNSRQLSSLLSRASCGSNHTRPRRRLQRQRLRTGNAVHVVERIR